MEIMTKKLLPIEIPPMVTSQYLAFCLAITRANPQTKDYYYNHYIQWVFHINDEQNNCYLEFYKSSCFNSDILEGHWQSKKDTKDLMETIRTYVDNQCYVLIDGVDVFFLENTSDFEVRHTWHDILVYGYDDYEKLVYIMAYDVNEKLSVYPVSQSSLIKGFYSSDISSEGCACSFKAFNNIKIECNTKIIKEQLTIYLTENKVKMKTKEIMGYGVYDYLVKYLDEVKEQKIFFDYKNFRLFMEHKKCMLDRIKKLRIELLFPSEIEEKYYLITKKAENIWNLVLKYRRNKDQKAFPIIQKFIREIKVEEKPILYDLLSFL